MKNKKILLLTITLVISVSQIDAMQQVIGRNFGRKLIRSLPKEIAKKAFSKTMTALHWGIAAGPMISDGIFQCINNEIFGVKLPHDTENVSNMVKEFAQLTLDTENVDVMKTSDAKLYTLYATNKHIFLDKDFSRKLDSLWNIAIELTEKNRNFNNTLLETYTRNILNKKLKRLKQHFDEASFLLHHEHNHQKARDLHRFSAAQCAIPLTTLIATHMISRKVLPFTKSSSGIKWLFRELSKIPTGFAKLLISYGLYMTYRIHREQEADNKVPDDKATLQGGINFFEKLTADQENYRKNLPPNSKEAFEEDIKLFVAKFLDPHPSNEKRIKKLEKRIEKLDS